MMDKNIIREEQEEVLENTASSIPENLKSYLQKDEETLGKIEEVLSDLDRKIETLNQEKIDSEKSFDDRLAEFQEMIAKEKEAAFNEFARREQDIDAEKARIENIKLEEQGNQVNYIDSLKEISDKFGSKISSIEDAIKACEDNETLNTALEEEKKKLDNALENEYNSRKEVLNKVLTEIGFSVEEKVLPKVQEDYFDNNFDPNMEINLDFRTPEEKENDILMNDIPNNIDIYDENEIVSHEPRPDIINEIYESEDIMENHVFPYLRSVRD